MHDLFGQLQGEVTAAPKQWYGRCDVGPTEASWQHAVEERHSAALGDIVRMTVEEQAGPDETKLTFYDA
eukprot:12896977-Prorocentrum_lima.AAC.1